MQEKSKTSITICDWFKVKKLAILTGNSLTETVTRTWRKWGKKRKIHMKNQEIIIIKTVVVWQVVKALSQEWNLLKVDSVWHFSERFQTIVRKSRNRKSLIRTGNIAERVKNSATHMQSKDLLVLRQTMMFIALGVMQQKRTHKVFTFASPLD